MLFCVWVGFSSVVSQEAPIPLAPCSEAAQPNHANPIPHLGKNPSELCRIIFMIWIKDLLRKETSTKVIKRGTTDQRFYVFPLKNIRSWKVPKHKFCLLPVGQHELVVVLVLGIITSLLDIWPHIQYFSLLKTFLKFLKFNTNSKTQKKVQKTFKTLHFFKIV